MRARGAAFTLEERAIYFEALASTPLRAHDDIRKDAQEGMLVFPEIDEAHHELAKPPRPRILKRSSAAAPR